MLRFVQFASSSVPLVSIPISEALGPLFNEKALLTPWGTPPRFCFKKKAPPRSCATEAAVDRDGDPREQQQEVGKDRRAG